MKGKEYSREIIKYVDISIIIVEAIRKLFKRASVQEKSNLKHETREKSKLLCYSKQHSQKMRDRPHQSVYNIEFVWVRLVCENYDFPDLVKCPRKVLRKV